MTTYRYKVEAEILVTIEQDEWRTLAGAGDRPSVFEVERQIAELLVEQLPEHGAHAELRDLAVYPVGEAS